MEVELQHNIVFTYDDEDKEWQKIEAATEHLGLTIEKFVEHAIWLGISQVYDEEAQKAYMRAERALIKSREEDTTDE